MNNATTSKITVNAEDIAIIAEMTDCNDHSGAVLALANILHNAGAVSQEVVRKAEIVVEGHESKGYLDMGGKILRDFVRMTCIAHLDNAKEVHMAF